jgi:hypothetical protein
MPAEDVIRDYLHNPDACAWNEGSMLFLLALFIDEQGLADELAEFLGRMEEEERAGCAGEENSDEDDED